MIFLKKLGISLGLLAGALLMLPAAAFAAEMREVSVNTDYAYVYIPGENDRNETLSAPYHTALPKGTVDFMTEEKTENIPDVGLQTYYYTTSGRKLLKSNVTLGSTVTQIPQNSLSSVSVSSQEEATTLTIQGNWNVPFNVSPDGVTYASSSSNTVSSFNPQNVVVTLDYSTASGISLPDTFPRNSCFDSCTVAETQRNGVKQVVLTFHLKESAYYGCYSSWNSQGELELKFLNPIDSLQDARIVLDPGHGYNGSEAEKDVGAVGSGLMEYQINYAKAQALKAELEKRGATVYMLDTMGQNYHLLASRVNAAISWQPHLYISLHHDSTTNSTAGGVTTYYNTPFSKTLAENLQNALVSCLRTELGYEVTDRGYKFKEYAVTCSKCFPSVLIEHGFISNPTEIAVLTDPDNLPVIASAEADAIEAFLLNKELTLTPVEPTTPPSTPESSEPALSGYEKTLAQAAANLTDFSER